MILEIANYFNCYLFSNILNYNNNHMFVSKLSTQPFLKGFRFSTVNSIANKTYAKFQQAYSQNTQSF